MPLASSPPRSSPQLWPRPAQAADAVKIGVIYPLTGNAAPAGQAAKAAVELGAEIVNTAHPGFAGLPLADRAGLPNLGGAKIELVSRRPSGQPLGRPEPDAAPHHPGACRGDARRLSVLGDASTATAVAERYGVPFLVGDSVGAQHHRSAASNGCSASRRSPRISPGNYIEFLSEMKKRRQEGRQRSPWCTRTPITAPRSAAACVEAAKKAGFAVIDITYNANVHRRRGPGAAAQGQAAGRGRSSSATPPTRSST